MLRLQIALRASKVAGSETLSSLPAICIYRIWVWGFPCTTLTLNPKPVSQIPKYFPSTVALRMTETALSQLLELVLALQEGHKLPEGAEFSIWDAGFREFGFRM